MGGAGIQNQTPALLTDPGILVNGKYRFKMFGKCLLKIGSSPFIETVPCSELELELLPSDLGPSREVAHSIGQPHVDIERHRRSLERGDGPHVDWNRVVDNFFEESLIKQDLRFPNRGLLRLPRIPTQMNFFSNLGVIHMQAMFSFNLDANCTTKQAIHLVFQSGYRSPSSSRRH